jgi:hypothetical protein
MLWCRDCDLSGQGVVVEPGWVAVEVAVTVTVVGGAVSVLAGAVIVLVGPGWVTVRAAAVRVSVTVRAMSPVDGVFAWVVAALAGGVGALITLSTRDT